MCGIVGYIGPRNAAQIIMDGLQRLEYRGYDSAGIAVIQDGQIAIRRDVGKLSNLVVKLAQAPVTGHIGIGHTRWATHGKPSERNAHPHADFTGRLVVVQNGIVENFRELRAELEAEGIEFKSETDTEVIAHLIGLHCREGAALPEAVRLALAHLRGPSAIVALSLDRPDMLVAARLGNAGGVTVGFGEGEMFIASDMPAILEHTRRMAFLENRQLAVVTADGATFCALDGQPVRPTVHTIPWDPISAAKGEYKHFMQKEIYEQANSLTDTIRGRVDLGAGEVYLEQLALTPARARGLTQIVSVACGTSYHSELVGAFMFEQLARLPVRVEYASEFRYRDPVLEPGGLALFISCF
jgi:glucosamine--fructose-6-phosphate aminotransferase (isomerizing)